MDRHKELAIRKPEGVTNASANVVEQDIRKWFREVYSILQDENLIEILRNAKCVLNGDESSFYLDPAVDKVIAMRGEKNVYKVDRGPAKKNITVMFTCSAAGKMFPPMVVLPYKKIPSEVTRSVPADWGIGKTESGWMTTSCFLKYIKHILHPQLVDADALPAIYFIDGHSSHTAWETAEECRKLGIHLVCLYANCTRILQPLDVAVFKPLKSSWARTVDDWKIANANKYLKTENFAPLLANAMDLIDSNVIKKGFECCGLFPFDEDNVDYTKCLGRNRSNFNPDDELNEPADATVVDRQLSHPQEPGTTNGTVETFSVIRSKAEEILQLMGPNRLERYRTRDMDDFDSQDERILFRVFKLLEPLYSMVDNQEQIEVEAMDSGEQKEEILAEFLIDQPDSDYECPYILKIDPHVPDDEPITDSQIGSRNDNESIGDVVEEPKDDSKLHHSLLSEFLESPETPHRKGNIKYKRKSPAVLTSRRRLLYHKAVKDEKEREAEEKLKRAEERENKKARKSKNKETMKVKPEQGKKRKKK